MGVIGLCLLLSLTWQSAWGEEVPLSSVLSVASERHTSLALNDVYFPQFARLGFGAPDTPWHPWFGTSELKALLYLPGNEMGRPFEISPRTLIGSRFDGKVWTSGFEALRRFDADQNGVVESDELNALYVWTDADNAWQKSSCCFDHGPVCSHPQAVFNRFQFVLLLPLDVAFL